jgi:hypothetical protein
VSHSQNSRYSSQTRNHSFYPIIVFALRVSPSADLCALTSADLCAYSHSIVDGGFDETS